MQKLSRFRSFLLAGTGLVLPAAAGAQTLAPNTAPVLDRVVAGSITVHQDTAQTVVQQAQQRGIVEWRTFNVGQNHQVQFQQPGTSSVTLNRVMTSDPSVIAGRINANGQIAIVNQSGVVFTQGSQVNAAGLVVSSANITNENFMAGRMVFDLPGRPDARIENSGTITIREAGLAALVAPQVANRGTINARLGRVALAGGETHVVDLYGDGLLSIEVTGAVRQAPSGGEALVTNTGVIEATGGRIQLTAAAADGIVQDLVRASGRISADTDAATGRTGTITISGTGGAVRVEGEVRAVGTASGTRGGRIEVVADRVLVDQGARVDASGAAGGGEVAVGTTLRGSANPRLARRTGIAEGATVRADATERGRGGTVIVNSQDYTAHAGTISARGGPQGGDGGFVEVSGQGGLFVLGSIDTSAPSGAPGTILIDPVDLSIIPEGDTIIGADQANLTGNVLGAADPPDQAFLYPSQFESLAGDVILQASNDITVNADIDRVGGGLALEAGRDILVNASITTDGALTLDAGRNLTVSGGMNVGGNLDMFARTGNAVIDSNVFGSGGALSLTAGGGITVSSLIEGFQGMTLTAQTGDVVLNSFAGLIDATGGPGISITAGNGILIGGGNGEGSASIITDGLLDLQAGAGGISQTAAIEAGLLQIRTPADAILDIATNDQLLSPNRVGTLGASNVGGNLQLSSTETGDTGQPLTIEGTVEVGGRLTLLPLYGVTQDQPSVIQASELVVNTGYSILLGGDNRIATVAGLTAGDALSLRNTIDLLVAGPVTVDNGGGTAVLAINVVGGNLTAAAPVTATSGEGFSLVALSAGGNLAVASTGSVTADGPNGSFISLAAAADPGGSTDFSQPGALTLAGNVTTVGDAFTTVQLGAGTGGILQTGGGITTGYLTVGSGGDALLSSAANAIGTLGYLEAVGNFVLDNGANDLLISTGPSYETVGTAATIGLRTAGTIQVGQQAELTATGDQGRVSFRAGALLIDPDAVVTGALVEIAPFNVMAMRVPLDMPNLGEFSVSADTLSRLSFQTLRLGATTFDGVMTTTADGLSIADTLTIPGTLDLRSLAGITQDAGANLLVGTLTGASGGTTVLANPGNVIATLAGFDAGGDFNLLTQGPLLTVPAGTIVTAGGTLAIQVIGGGLLVDGTVTGASTSLLADTSLVVNGFSAIARTGSLLLQATDVTVAGLASAGTDLTVQATGTAQVSGTAQAGNTALLQGSGVTLAGLASAGGDLTIEASGTAEVTGTAQAGNNLLVQGADVRLAGLASAGGDITVRGSLTAQLAGTAQTSNALLIVSPSVTFGGLDARTADVRIDLGLAGFATGGIDAGELLVQGGSGARLTGTIAGIPGRPAAAVGRRASTAGVIEPDPPPNANDFTFNDCPIGTAICAVQLIPLPLMNPGAVLAVLDPAQLLAAVDQLRPPTPDLALQPTRDPTEEGELAPPDIRSGDY